MIPGAGKDERGIALVVILAVLALLCIIGVTLVTTSRIENKASIS
jgi:Tfp pilus assembly protein PilX